MTDRDNTLIVATHNPGKLREIQELIQDLGLTAVSAADLDLPEPEETGTTFADNALLKARAAAKAGGHPAIADDSGLCADALGGQPGIYSARWFGPGRDSTPAFQRIQEGLAGGQTDAAHFICVIAHVDPDGAACTYEGRVDGRIVFPPRGDNGFGYDPIFVPAGESRTFGEMAPAEKHAMSHRARALQKWRTALNEAGLREGTSG